MNIAITQIKILTATREVDRICGYGIEPDTKNAIKFAATDDFNLFVPAAILVVSGLFRLASEPATVGLLVRSIIAEVFIPNAGDEPDEKPEADFDIPDERLVGVGDSLPSGTDCAGRNLSNVPAPTPARTKRAAKSSKSDTKKPSRNKKSASLSIAA